MDRKNFLMATLISVVLLTVVFSPISTQQGVREYDPWADIVEPYGEIDIRDVSAVARAWATSGDPTRNVTIMLSYYEWEDSEWLNPYEDWFGRNITAGYREVTFYINVVGALEVTVFFNGNVYESFTVTYDAWRTYSVRGSEITVRAHNPSATELRGLYYYIYVTT